MKGCRLYPFTIALAGADQRALREIAEKRKASVSATARDLLCAAIDREMPEHVARMELLGVRR